MIAGDDLGVARRRGTVAPTFARIVMVLLLLRLLLLVLLLLGLVRRLGRRRVGAGRRLAWIARCPVIRGVVRRALLRLVLRSALRRRGVDEDVCYAAAFAVVAWDDVVFVGWFGVLGDDVPGVDEARELWMVLVRVW